MDDSIEIQICFSFCDFLIVFLFIWVSYFFPQTTQQLEVFLEGSPHTSLTPVVNPISINIFGDSSPPPSQDEEEIAHCQRQSTRGLGSEGQQSDEGWDSAEGLKVMNLRRRGLLSTGRNLIEKNVNVTVNTSGTVSCIALWFGMRGIVSSGNTQSGANFEYIKIKRNKPKNDSGIEKISNSYEQQSKICIQQTIQTIFADDTESLNQSIRNNDRNSVSTDNQSVAEVDSTLEEVIVTVGLESPCCQSLFVLEDPLDVGPGDKIVLDCVYREGCFWAELLRHIPQQ